MMKLKREEIGFIWAGFSYLNKGHNADGEWCHPGNPG